MNALTELEAVNLMLSMIGEAPVNTVDGSKSADVAQARTILTEISREVQSGGWHFNTEYQVELTPDTVTSEIYLAPQVLRIDIEPADTRTGAAGKYVDAVQRGNRLYDRENKTYEFTQTVKATVVYGLDWDIVPQPAKQYIAVRAGRVFCDRMVGAADLHRVHQLQEVQALVSFRNWEAEMADHTIFDNFDVYRIINRQGQPNSV